MTRLQKSLFTWTALLLALCLASGCTSLWRKARPVDKGGFELIVAVKADPSKLDQSIEQTMAVIQKRCDRLEIYCKLQRRGGNEFMLRVSSSMESMRVKGILLAEGLELRPVISPLNPAPVQLYPTQEEATAAAAGSTGDVLHYEEEEGNTERKVFVVVERTPIITGENVRRAEASSSPNMKDRYQIFFQLDPAGASRLGEWTSNNINRYLAVILNKRVISMPYIRSQITDQGEISGGFTKQAAEDLAQVMMSGNLPAPLELLEERTYRP